MHLIKQDFSIISSYISTTTATIISNSLLQQGAKMKSSIQVKNMGNTFKNMTNDDIPIKFLILFGYELDYTKSY